MSLPQLQKADLVTVNVETLEGDVYRFPSMPLPTLRELGVPSHSISFLTLVNQSNAVVTIPWRIMKELYVECADGKRELLWSRSQ